MDAELADALRRHRTQQVQERLALGPAWQHLDLVCCRFDGGIWRPSRLSLDFTPIARMLEDECALSTRGATFHTLRHTHATLMLAAGVPVHVVSRRLGHSKIQITLDFYAHVIPGQDEDAAGAFADLFSEREDRTMHTERTYEAVSEPVMAVQ